MASQTLPVETLPKGTVIISGGGPVALIVAYTLAFYGVKSKLFERNKTTTKWPKMDLTNGRSMEILRKLGLADGHRHEGVPGDIDQDVIFSSGLSADKAITSWKLPGANKYRERIREKNDGTMPREPWQRLSQVYFEKWLMAICQKNPLIDINLEHKVESVEEDDEGAKALVTDFKTGSKAYYKSDYLVGCDGAGSKTRKSLNIPLDGGPV